MTALGQRAAMSLSRELVVQVSKYIIIVARGSPKKTTNSGKSSRATAAGQTGEVDKVRMKGVFNLCHIKHVVVGLK